MCAPEEDQVRPLDILIIRSRRFVPWCARFLLIGAALSAQAQDRELSGAPPGSGVTAQVQQDGPGTQRQNNGAAGPLIAFDQAGLSVRSADGLYAFEIGARLHADFASHSGDSDTGVEATDGTELRRARIELSGMIQGDWRWVAETDLADDDVSVKDFWLRYQGFDRIRLTVGHQKQPYSLALEMSANDIPFIERSIANDLIVPFVDRAIGIRADAWGANWFAAGGLYGESVSPGSSGDEGWGFAGRYVFAPIIAADRVLHLALRGAYREPADAASSIQIRDETTHVSSLSIVDTGVLTGVDSVTLFGPEIAYVKGRFSLVSEYNRASVKRAGASDLGFSSWHLDATWSLTGESRAAIYRIDDGEFKRLTPARNFRRGAGARGAWELTARYASIDLNDDGVTGGREETFTAGANWYVNPSVRLLFAWTRILTTDGSTPLRAGAEGIDVFAFRAQYAF
ncbi:MAG: OprO/OprP family phosphate-selective porin [Gammaproteobacteria bacterium]|nr:OprO/OprP family phosphate-selective porin [Gammaproteobacteria bacterium]